MPQPAASTRTDYATWWLIFSGIASSLSVINLILKFYKVGLAHVLSELIAWYKHLLYPFIDALTSWMPYALPDWYKDMFILSSILLGAIARSVAGASVTEIGKRDGTLPVGVIRSRANFGLKRTSLTLPNADGGFVRTETSEISGTPLTKVGLLLAAFAGSTIFLGVLAIVPLFGFNSLFGTQRSVLMGEISRRFRITLISCLIAVVAFFATNSQI
jgi:hypothetical protein